MKKAEIVRQNLLHNATKQVPFYCELTAQMHERLTAYTKDENFLDKFNLYLHFTQYCGYPTELADKPMFFKDDFGVIWNRSGADRDIGVIDRPLLTEDFKGFIEPVLDEKRLRKDVENLCSTAQDKFKIAGIGFSMFERSWSLCGMENALSGMIEFPDEYAELLDKICAYNCKVLDILLDYPLDGIYFGDDWGQQKGLIMGKPLWLKFIKPQMKKLYAKAKSKGAFVMQHSCGDIEEIFDDLIEIGLDCYQTFQPEIYDIEAVKTKYGAKLNFWGGISTQKLLPYATPEKVRTETKRIIEIMRKNGGYIAAPTHAVPFDVPPENLIAMLETFESFSQA